VGAWCCALPEALTKSMPYLETVLLSTRLPAKLVFNCVLDSFLAWNRARESLLICNNTIMLWKYWKYRMNTVHIPSLYGWSIFRRSVDEESYLNSGSTRPRVHPGLSGQQRGIPPAFPTMNTYRISVVGACVSA
jgi:hypothetical protein